MLRPVVGAIFALLGCGLGACGAAEAGGDEPAAPAASTGRQRVATGVRLGYSVQGDPAGPALILLHGYGDSRFSFAPILPLIPPRYRVHALDLRGHGESDQPAVGYHMADLAADVLAYMDARRIPRAVVVGHSMGTFVAQYMARAAPDRVDGLMLIAPAPTIRYLVGVDELGAAAASFTDSVPDSFIREFQASTVHRPLDARFMERVVSESRKLLPPIWSAVMDGMLASDAVRPGAPVPARILAGDRDAVFPAAARDSVAAALGTTAVLVYPETGHAVHWERPAEVAAELIAFMAEVAPGSEPPAPLASD